MKIRINSPALSACVNIIALVIILAADVVLADHCYSPLMGAGTAGHEQCPRVPGFSYDRLRKVSGDRVKRRL
jgi:hypothetical protein